MADCFIPDGEASHRNSVLNSVADLNRVGAQWCRQEQRAECSYAWSSGLQRPAPHTTIHGAHPQGTQLFSFILNKLRYIENPAARLLLFVIVGCVNVNQAVT